MAKTTLALERYLTAARDIGCPPDQVRNFRRASYVAQPKQLRFHAAAREADEPNGPTEIGFGGARGGGKTHCLAEQMAADDCQRAPGIKCLLLRKVGKAVRESFEDLRRKHLMELAHKYNRSDGTLVFENDSRIILGHFKNESDIDSYLGLEYEVVGVEEATTLSLSKYKAIRTCNRTSRDDWRPRTYSNTNPGGIGHVWYKQRFIEPYRKEGESATRFVPATVDDNVFVNPEYRKTLDDLTGWRKRAWRYGDWDIAAGQYFTTWRREIHVVEPRKLSANWTAWCAMDYGFTHPTVVYLLAQDGDGNVYVVDEHWEQRWLARRHAEAIKALLARNGLDTSRLDAFVASPDVFAKRGTEQTIAETYSDYGIELSSAQWDRVSGAAKLLDLLGDVDASIAPKLFIFNRCARLIECIPEMQHDPNRPEDILKTNVNEEGAGGDDAYDAVRYGVMEVGRKGLEAGVSPLAGYRGSEQRAGIDAAEYRRRWGFS